MTVLSLKRVVHAQVFYRRYTTAGKGTNSTFQSIHNCKRGTAISTTEELKTSYIVINYAEQTIYHLKLRDDKWLVSMVVQMMSYSTLEMARCIVVRGENTENSESL